MTPAEPIPTLTLFMIFIVVVLFVVARFGRSGVTRSDFYVGGRTFTAPQNGIALFGTFMLMTSFLALSGEVALKGYDAMLFAASFAVSWAVVLFLVAEPLRNTGRYSLGDTLSVRFRERPVRLAAATVTLVVFFFYMTIQMVGAGSLVALMLGWEGPLGQATVIVTVGSLTAVIVQVGGMRGTTWTQIIKSGLLAVAVLAVAVALLVHYRFDLSALLGAAADRAGPEGDRLLVPGQKFDAGPDRMEFVSQLLSAVLGHAALPYLFLRFLTVADSRETRRSVAWATWIITPYYLLIVLIGFGAAALVGPERIQSAPGQRLSAVPLLAAELGGVPLLAFVGSVVFLVVVGLTCALVISAAGSFTRDVYANLRRNGPPDDGTEVAVARRAVVVLCGLMTVVAVLLMNQNVGFMLALDVTLVASSVLPTLLYTWFWRGFTTTGALWSMYGGGAATVLLVVFSPSVSGDPMALFPGADFAYFPWRYVGLASIPVGFLLGYLGARLGPAPDAARFAEMQVRTLTGAGASEATPATGAAGTADPVTVGPDGAERR